MERIPWVAHRLRSVAEQEARRTGGGGVKTLLPPSLCLSVAQIALYGLFRHGFAPML